jgi:C1A family cysteine protease
MKRSLLLLGFTTTWLFGCAGAAGPGAAPGSDDEAPLSSYNGIFHNVPSNSTLPDDNKADAVYPRKSSELVALQSPVRNQAHRGVCTIFSTTALMEHLYIKAGLLHPDFSEQYLQWAVKSQLGAYADSEGSNNGENIEAIHRFGIVEENLWPYNPDNWTEANDPDCKNDGSEDQTLPTKCWTQGEPPAAAATATKYKLPSGSWLSTRSIKQHITMEHTAVVLGIDFFYQAWNHGLSTLPISQDDLRMGIVRYPNSDDVTESHKQRAGHGILIVGWDDDLEFPRRDKTGAVVKDAQGNPVMEKGFYIFKNSWGTTRFGVNNPYGAGYGFIAQRYVAQYATAYVSGVPTIQPNPNPNPNPNPGASAHTFSNSTSQAIPDNDPAGISSTISAPDHGTLQSVSVTVDISHTWRGDLTLALVHGSKTVTLLTNDGGSADDVKQTFTADFTGADSSGDWTLTVVDGAAQDVGTLNSWSVTLTY